MKSLASDNYSGVVPEVLSAIAAANDGHAVSYGHDQYTARAGELFNELFGREVRFLFAFNGTGANLLGLGSVIRPYHGIVCTDYSHMYVDESTAPELFTGARLRPVPISINGKLEPQLILPFLRRSDDVHYARVLVVSVAQTTEYGTVYSVEELKELSRVCHEHNLYLHIDGARLLNAAASLNISLKEMLTDTGVDLLTFGITKAGALAAEAVIYLNPVLGDKAAFYQKRNAQLCSKSRFTAAQFIGLLEQDTWKKYTLHANQMATRLSELLAGIPKVKINKPVQANAVFATMPLDWIIELQKIIPFYLWDEERNEVRLMCSWDTTEDDLQLLTNALHKLSRPAKK